MSLGYVKSDWHYRKPISDPILLWWFKTLRSPCLWLYNVTGRSIPTLQRLESMLWSRAAKHTQIQIIHYFDIFEGTEKSLSTGFLGGKRIIVGLANLSDTSSTVTKKQKLAWPPGYTKSQGRK